MGILFPEVIENPVKRYLLSVLPGFFCYQGLQKRCRKHLYITQTSKKYGILGLLLRSESLMQWRICRAELNGHRQKYQWIPAPLENVQNRLNDDAGNLHKLTTCFLAI